MMIGAYMDLRITRDDDYVCQLRMAPEQCWRVLMICNFKDCSEYIAWARPTPPDILVLTLASKFCMLSQWSVVLSSVETWITIACEYEAPRK